MKSSIRFAVVLRVGLLVTVILLNGPRAAAQPPVTVLKPYIASEFTDIHVSVLGPNTVEIDWAPLQGADLYRVYRDGIQVDTNYSATSGDADTFTAYDYKAPANSTVKYTVTASRKTTEYGLPGTPAAGKSVTIETLMITSNAAVAVTPAAPPPPPVVPPLTGFVDLHAHPASYLGFGGKLLYGAPDAGATLPPGCNDGIAAADEFDALGHEYRAYGSYDLLKNPCGDSVRAEMMRILPGALHANGYMDTLFDSGPQSMQHPGAADFPSWPAWNDVLRQKMWVDWIRRAYDGGLRVMVALAVNNKLLGDIVGGSLPTDDLAATDNQIREIKAFASRHADFMQVVYSAADLHNAVAQNKLAIVLGVEIDNIGNLVGSIPAPVLNGEIDRLYSEGVRYIFPVHLVDNAIGGTAVYVDLFNVANVYEELGAAWDLDCRSGITYNYKTPDSSLAFGAFVKLGTGAPSFPPSTPCPVGSGNVNKKGLSDSGKAAIQHMMDRGMLIDVDHMSELAVNDAIAIAERNYPVLYPLNSGHNSIRGSSSLGSTERGLTAEQYWGIAQMHGMTGIGSACETSRTWLQTVQKTLGVMNLPSNAPLLAFGTDADGLEFMMPPRLSNSADNQAALQTIMASCSKYKADTDNAKVTPNSKDFPLRPATDHTRTWDYNRDGVANYGLLPDFLQDVKSLPGGADIVTRMNNGAQYFYETWLLAERDAVKTCVMAERYDPIAKVCNPIRIQAPVKTLSGR